MSTWLEDYASKLPAIIAAIEDAINSSWEDIASSLSAVSREIVISRLISKASEEIGRRPDYQALEDELNEAIDRSDAAAASVLGILVGQTIGTIGCYASLNCKVVEVLSESDSARRQNAARGGANSATLSAAQLEEFVKPFIDRLVNLGTSVSEASRQAGAQLRSGQMIPGQFIDIGDEAIRKRYGKL